MYPIDDIRRTAEEELAAEERRRQINNVKDRLRARANQPWHVRIFPWRIVIVRIDHGDSVS